MGRVVSSIPMNLPSVKSNYITRLSIDMCGNSEWTDNYTVPHNPSLFSMKDIHA